MWRGELEADSRDTLNISNRTQWEILGRGDGAEFRPPFETVGECIRLF
jgi:hypothetical protein